MRTFMKKIAVVIISIILSSINAYANDTAFGGSGSAPMPIEQTDVQMASEHVVITGRDLIRGWKHGMWDVTCDFTFVNTLDKPVKVKMGFPFPARNEEMEANIPEGKKVKIGDPMVYDFKAFVRSAPVAVTKQKLSPNVKLGLEYDTGFIWEVEFAPKETVQIRNTYNTATTFDVMGYTWVNYVLKTGGNWKNGAIGRSQIEVVPNVPAKLCSELDKNADYLGVEPAGVKTEGKGAATKFVWDLKNFRPQNDLQLCMQTGGDYVRQKILMPVRIDDDVEKSVSKMKKEDLRILRNTVYAQYGMIFKDESLNKYFAGKWWYAPNPNFEPKDLTPEDKELVSAISKVESHR